MKRQGRKIRKLTLTVIAWLIILTLAPSATATETTQIYLVPNQIIGAEHEPSTSITVSIMIENVTELKVLALNLSYKPGILSCRGYALTHPEQIESIQYASSDETGFIFLNISLRNGLTSQSPLQIANIIFHIIKRGETSINITVIKIININGNPIGYAVKNGYFSNLSLYDVNADGKIDIEDLALVAYSLGAYPGHPRWNPKADVNRDGTINIIDVTLVAANFGHYP